MEEELERVKVDIIGSALHTCRKFSKNKIFKVKSKEHNGVAPILVTQTETDQTRPLN